MKKMAAVVAFASMLCVQTGHSMEAEQATEFLMEIKNGVDIEQSTKKLLEERKNLAEAFAEFSSPMFGHKNSQQKLQQVESAIEKGKALKEKYEMLIREVLLEVGQQGIKKQFDELSNLQNGMIKLSKFQGEYKVRKEVENMLQRPILMKDVLEEKSKSSWCLIM